MSSHKNYAHCLRHWRPVVDKGEEDCEELSHSDLKGQAFATGVQHVSKALAHHLVPALVNSRHHLDALRLRLDN
eukprot:5290360-Amphidinium_carterae.1